MAGVTTVEEANRFLRERYIAEFNAKFTVKPAQPGTAFRNCGRRDLDHVFSIQTERVVDKDNTVAIGKHWWQIGKCRWRHSLAGQTVTIHHHLDHTVDICWGPHLVGHYEKDCGNDGAVDSVENQKQVSPRSHRPLENASSVSHIPTAPIPSSFKSNRKKVA